MLTEASTRDDLALHFREQGFTRGAEIGVEQGEYSEVLCWRNPLLRLLCVDAWRAYRGYREHVTQAKLDAFYEAACQRLAKYSAEIWRMFSVEAAARVVDASLDFVYIDANHERSQVDADLAAWAPKVRSGGIVAGHDYCRRKGMNYGVKDAVRDYMAAHVTGPLSVLRGDKAPTWLWVQP